MTTSTKSLRVWPPDAARVDLVLAWDRVAMEPAEHGWWTSPAPVPAGSDYRFSVDGGDPLPDPRSPWQPAGVQGASRVLDHDTFAWTDSGWQAPPLASGVIYELHVSTFTPQGSYEGAITWLDHHEDPDLARAVSEGRRREFAAFGGQPEDVPDPQAPETFLGSRLDWTEIAREPHASLFAWRRDLSALRRRGDAVGTGDERPRARYDDKAGWLVVSFGARTVACNLGPRAQNVPLDPGVFEIVLASEDSVRLATDGVELPSDSVVVLDRVRSQ